MVLGAIGYVVHKENLGISGLRNLLDEQREDVSKALPPLIAPHLPLRAIAPITEEATLASPSAEGRATRPKVEKKVVKSNDKSFANSFLPWLFLIVLALLSAYYMRSCRVTQEDTDIDKLTMNDSLLTDNSSGVLDDSLNKMGGEQDTMLFGSDNVRTDTSEITIPPQDEVVETPPVAPRTASPSRNIAQAGNSSRTPDAPLLSTQQLRNSRSWVDMSSESFEPGSAEVKNQGEIIILSSYLRQNPNATISIAPAGSGRIAEDRAYAIREQLYQKGIDISRITIEPARGNGNGVSLKVNR